MTSTQTCPTCIGGLSELAQAQELQYRCEFGHRFTASALVHEQTVKTSNLVGATFRAVYETQTLSKRLASNAMAHRWAERADAYNLAASVGQR
jgi:hypothetical protein